MAELDAAAADPRFATNAGRVEHYAALQPIVAAAVARRPLKDWTSRLREARVPAGAVRSIDELFADPQMAARDMVVTVNHPTVGPMRTLGVPVKLSETPGGVRTPPPRLGEHTAQVLSQDLGLSRQEIESLKDQGTIGVLEF